MYCLETEDLSHHFNPQSPSLKNIRLQVPEQSIYGFLGPNGAGKTTTLKLILGLLKKQQGRVTVFGKEFDRNRLEILGKTGSLIESPSFYSQLTARENLKVFQRIYECPSVNIEKVLEQCGLSDTGNKPAGRFSLGMKQRLGIAVALLHNPALLVLDEPTNGLDPAGIIDIRELLRTINREQGTTILVSSHLLTEVEKLATHTGIIHQGELLFQGKLEELLQQRRQSGQLLVETGDPEAARAVLQQYSSQVVAAGAQLLLPVPPRETIAAINRQLVEQGISVYSIQPIHNNLETIFMNLINQN